MNQANSLFARPAAWYGPEMAKTEEWIYQLTPQEVDELDAALSNVSERAIAPIEVNRENFPLPTLGKALSDIRREVVNGRGFVLIRGVPVKRYSIEESVIVYWGMGTYLGQAVPQNAKGHLLGHVKDLGNDPHDPLTRIYTTNYRQPYHTDSCDVVALLCLNKAKSGGLSTISSSATIYNEMMQQRPDLVEVLFEPFTIDRKGEIPKGKQPTYQMPVFHQYGGHLTTIYARDFIEAAQQRHADIPRLTDQQLEALDMLDSLARNETIRLDMVFEPGDIQLLHNHQILHARTPYEDYTKPERRRHLLRLWLSQPDGRPLPPVFEERYGNIELGTRRGGIIVSGTVENIPLEAI